MKFYATTAVNDAMNQKNTMDPGIKPVSPSMKVIGKAYTVDCLPGSIITCHRALAEAPEGSVLVINGRENPNGALWGELMTTEAMERRIKGVVIEGAVRDVDAISKLKFPTFSRYITPSVGSNRRVGTTGHSIVCGGVAVNTGDLIVADADGVVVVPQDRIDEVLKRAEAIDHREKELAQQVKSGGHLADILGMTPAINQAKNEENK